MGGKMKGEIGIEGIGIKLSKKLEKASNKAKRRNYEDPKVWLVI